MLNFIGHTIVFSGMGAAMLGTANNPNLPLPEVSLALTQIRPLLSLLLLQMPPAQGTGWELRGSEGS